jgi:conjugal transfer pilus assembly protein TraD
MTSSREDIIPTDQLGALPNTEFFASLAGGRIVKGRVPILICNEE